jgi:hypothetical protein
MDESELLENLTLILLYAQSWRERVAESMYVARSWKGYDFDVLDRLSAKGYITGSHRARSVMLTDEGLKRGKELKQKILNNAELLANSSPNL